MIPEHYLKEARLAIDAAAATAPDLSACGFDIPGEHRYPFSLPQVATSLAFIDCGPLLQVGITNRHAKSSYGLKHDAERWGEVLGFEPYVANGDFICAALYRLIPIKRYERSPNCAIALRLAESNVRYPHSFVRWGVFQSSRA